MRSRRVPTGQGTGDLAQGKRRPLPALPQASEGDGDESGRATGGVGLPQGAQQDARLCKRCGGAILASLRPGGMPTQAQVYCSPACRDAFHENRKATWRQQIRTALARYGDSEEVAIVLAVLAEPLKGLALLPQESDLVEAAMTPRSRLLRSWSMIRERALAARTRGTGGGQS